MGLHSSLITYLLNDCRSTCHALSEVSHEVINIVVEVNLPVAWWNYLCFSYQWLSLFRLDLHCILSCVHFIDLFIIFGLNTQVVQLLLEFFDQIRVLDVHVLWLLLEHW